MESTHWQKKLEMNYIIINYNRINLKNLKIYTIKKSFIVRKL